MNRRYRPSAGTLLGPVLRSVSRSFYLSVRLLPGQLREPVGLAYLLARATDTVADTTEVPPGLRHKTLLALASAIQSGAPGTILSDLQQSFAPLQTDQAERRLIGVLSQCFACLDRIDPVDRRHIRVVLDKITRAQMKDVEWFGEHGELNALPTVADLDQYTYLIAGSVGEFWTEICLHHLRRFADRPAEEMQSLGREYGKGLQLINILRDAGSDLRNGRCYLPEEELKAEGIVPGKLLVEAARLHPILNRWRQKAENGIAAGMEYVLAIRPARVRVATALPALIGARTLALLRQAGPKVLEQRIKVPRKEVYSIIASSMIALGARKQLDAMFRKLSR